MFYIYIQKLNNYGLPKGSELEFDNIDDAALYVEHHSKILFNITICQEIDSEYVELGTFSTFDFLKIKKELQI